MASTVTSSLSASKVASTGVGSKDLTGADVAGNETTTSRPYIVAYAFLGFLEPASRATYKRGSRIPVRFRLGDASGTPISDSEATALLSPTCLVDVTFDGATMACPSYDPESHTFQYDVNTTKSSTVGDHSIRMRVSTSSGDVLNTNSPTVYLR